MQGWNWSSAGRAIVLHAQSLAESLVAPGVVWCGVECHCNTQEVKVGGRGGQLYPQLHMQFEGSLGFMRPCLKNNKQQTNQKQNNQRRQNPREDKTRQPTCDTRGQCCGDDSCPGAEPNVGWEVYSRILPTLLQRMGRTGWDPGGTSGDWVWF